MALMDKHVPAGNSAGRTHEAGPARYRDILRRGLEEYRSFLNPLMVERAQIAGEPLNITAVANGQLVDRDGGRYECFHGTQAFGHRHPAIAAAVREFLDSDAPSWYPSRISPFAGRLARRLCERSETYQRAYFALTGSGAVEAGLKLARAATRKPRILGMEGAYHGCTFGSTALMGKGPFRDPFGPHLPGVEALPFGDVDALRAAFAGGDVAAVVMEPIQGEGGIRPVPSEFVEAACELTARHDALLIADEVQTGLGRSGSFLASAHWPRRPDAVTIGKQLGGGLMPLSAMLSTEDWFERAFGRHVEAAESHNATFSYNTIGLVAGLAALDLLDEEMVAQVRARGEFFRDALRTTLDDSPLFAEVRGQGLMVGIQFTGAEHPWLSFEHFGMDEFVGRPSLGLLLCMRMYKRGYICFVCGHDWSTMRIQPRFDIEPDALQQFADTCRVELDYLHNLN